MDKTVKPIATVEMPWGSHRSLNQINIWKECHYAVLNQTTYILQSIKFFLNHVIMNCRVHLKSPMSWQTFTQLQRWSQ